jgi:DnaJ-class molecular chaperone
LFVALFAVSPRFRRMNKFVYLVVFALISSYSVFGFFGGGGQQRPAVQVEELDLYEILGLDEDADGQEIKKAFRSLSLKYHPDKHPGEIKKFQQVSRAYEILSDEELKYVYDFNGMSGVQEHEERKKMGDQGQDPFAMFFGGGQQRQNKGQNAQVEMQITLEQIYNGGKQSARIQRRIVCRGCADDDPKAKTKDRCKKCPQRCPPEVRLVQRQHGNMIFQQQEQVQSKHHCKNEDKDLEVTIEKGVADGAQITFPYASEQRPGQVPGDIIVLLKQKKHNLFERRDNHLHVNMKIMLKEALTGFKKEIPHLDGHLVPIVVSPGTLVYPFQTMVLNGEGMPLHEVPSQFGDLHVTFEVVFPKTLNEDQRNKLKEIL